MEHTFSEIQQMSRRTLIKLGVGSAATAVAAGVPLAHLASGEDEVLRFSGVGGLPEPPLPSYATHVVEGSVNLKDGTGTVTSRVLAGHPGAASSIGLPGLSRIMQISKVEAEDRRYRLQGVIEDRSQLQRGESSRVEIFVDKGKGVMLAPFLGRQVTLPLSH